MPEKKRSIRDSLKQWKEQQAVKPVEKKSIQEAAKSALLVGPKQVAEKRTGPPIVGYEIIQASCGHDIQFGLFEDKLDKFRKERRVKWQEKACEACRKLRREASEVESKIKREEKAKGNANQGKWKHGRLVDRLPHGSVFHVIYNAETQRWSGMLNIPKDDGSGEKTYDFQTFCADSSGVFKLLPKLDALYRQWLSSCSV